MAPLCEPEFPFRLRPSRRYRQKRQYFLSRVTRRCRFHLLLLHADAFPSCRHTLR